MNISLPPKMAKDVEKAVKSGRYATTSEFFRHLLRLWNARELAGELEKRRKEFGAGKGKVLRTLGDLH